MTGCCSSVFLRTLICKAPRDDFSESHQFGKDGVLHSRGMTGEVPEEREKKNNN